MPAMIELSAVTRCYGSEIVVDRVSFQVAVGELLVLVGGSGSGKTTTLKMINRLVEPTAGRICVAGEEITRLAPHTLRRRIGYVFQRLGLFPHLSIAENIGITPKLLGWERNRIRARVDELLNLVELDPVTLRDRRPEVLSGGQAQRVAVARALAASPPVLLLDEPFAALDPLIRERLQQSFTRIRKQLGLTGIFVTHDIVEALRLGDRVAVLRNGQLLQIGTGSSLIHSPADPYVAELIGAPLRQARHVEALLAGSAREIVTQQDSQEPPK